MKISKVIVLIVDIDDDFRRLGIDTPVIGYQNVYKAAYIFGLNKPDDSDLNAVFQGLKVYNEFKKQGYIVEIAVVSGDSSSLINAFLNINKQVEYVKTITGFNEIYFISDGQYDEQVIPILYNYGKVIGVERTIVTQSKSIETTYILLGRYFKKALTEQPYSKYFLGIPGLIILAYLVLELIGLPGYIWYFIAFTAGIVFVIRGFGFLDKLSNYWRLNPIIGFTYGAATMLLIYSVIVSIFALRIHGFKLSTLKYILDLTMLPLILSMFTYISGRIFSKVVRNMGYAIWRDAVFMIPAIFFTISLVNLYGLINSEQSIDENRLLNILSSQSISLPLILAVIFTLAFIVLFIILDHIFLKSMSSPAEPPFTRLITTNSSPEIYFSKIRPVDITEVEFTIR